MAKSILDLLKEQIIGRTFIQDSGNPNVIDKYKVLEVKCDGQGSTPRLVIQFEEDGRVTENSINFFYANFLDNPLKSAQSLPKCTEESKNYGTAPFRLRHGLPINGSTGGVDIGD